MRLAGAGVAFAALPGDDRPDAALLAASSVEPEDYAALHAYLTEGGSRNAMAFLRHAQSLIENKDGIAPPAEPLRG